ncbi:hypothetical protein NQ317_017095 [Molorchus minor]|uniref:Gag protein n=1 Tax=Molorchus minor TaxID=1323400 RepID=A0ABQ9JID1_9CUCU|nr:hypothetical protein NQ317_017095 [Molorchus minor]
MPLQRVLDTQLLKPSKNKLKGRAQNLIASRSDLTTWIGIEQLLKLTFGDQRDLQYLTHQLTTIRPNRNERPYDFGLRIQELRAITITRINNDFPAQETRDLQIQNYNNIAKTIFITNLPIHTQTIIRMKNPASLEDALNFVLEEEEFQNFAKLHQTSFAKHNPMISQNIQPNRNLQHNFGFNQNQPNSSFNQNRNPQNQPNSNFNQNRNPQNQHNFGFQHNPSFNQNRNTYPAYQGQNNFVPKPQYTNNYQTRPQFPSQPINIQSRPIKQNFPTNRQVFGQSTRQNVWKPNQNKNLPNATPMSGVSYVNNTETIDNEPPYHNDSYQNNNEYENQRYEDVTLLEINDEEIYNPSTLYADETTEQEQQQEDFMNAQSTSYPT